MEVSLCINNKVIIQTVNDAAAFSFQNTVCLLKNHGQFSYAVSDSMLPNCSYSLEPSCEIYSSAEHRKAVIEARVARGQKKRRIWI